MNSDLLALLSCPATTKLFAVFRLAGHEVRFVGGCVRDAIYSGLYPGQEVSMIQDIDLATTSTPQKTQEILRESGINYFDSGLKHGTITAVFGKVGYEITTLRCDTVCDGRHATVVFTDSWKEDAARRDFTFNALYMDEFGTIFDYFGGISDIKNRILRFIGCIEARIQEDYLRILRAFRFAARYASSYLAPSIVQAMKIYAPNIDQLSGERICSEMTKLLAALPSARIMSYLNEAGASLHVFGRAVLDYSPVQKFLDLVSETSALLTDQALTLLGLIVRFNHLDASDLRERWKFSNASQIHIQTIANTKLSRDLLEKPNKLLVLFGHLSQDLLLIAAMEEVISPEELKKIIDRIFNSHTPTFPILGRDLVALGLEGQLIGRSMKLLRASWLESNCQLDREALLNLIKT